MPAVSLLKGGNVNLTKDNPSLARIIAGLGWDVKRTDGPDYDLDVSVLLVGANGKVQHDLDFIFYNNKTSRDGSVVHNGDNRTGAGDGDDETVSIDLTRVPEWVQRIILAVTIDKADQQRQNFGGVENAYVRIVDQDKVTETFDGEITRYDLTEDSATETAMIFGEVYRNGADWKFKAVGQGFKGGLGPLARSFGVDA